MKYVSLCIITLCLILTSAKANSPWSWEHPLPQGNTLNDIDIYGPSKALAVGEQATAMVTFDKGGTWEVYPNVAGLNIVLNGVCFVDAATVVAVGDGGVIVRSVDTGTTWDVQVSGTIQDLNEISFGNAMYGTAVGDSGTILRTTDAGVTWNPQSSGTLIYLRGVSFAAADTGWVVGGYGLILRTTDGGLNWTEQRRDSSVILSSIHSLNDTTGTAVGYTSDYPSQPYVMGTTDGGDNWIIQPMPTLGGLDIAMLYSVCFTDADHGFAVGFYSLPSMEPRDPSGIYMRTINGGASWDWSAHARVANGIGMFDANNGLVVGGMGLIRKTEDGGTTWPQTGGVVLGWGYTMTGVDFIDPLRGIAVSSKLIINRVPDSFVYRTADGGSTWDSQQRSGVALIDVAYADADTAYAVGCGDYDFDIGAVILRSTDGGATWDSFLQIDCTTNCDMRRAFAVDFGGPSNGVVVGLGSNVITIKNGVPTTVSTPATGSLSGVSMPTTTVAYAVGDDGVIIKSIDGGDNWSELTSGIMTDLYDVSFSDEMNGTAVGFSGVILNTTDGGANWTPQVSGADDYLNCVSFVNALTGVIGGREGTFLITKDGGATWVPENTPSSSSNDVILIDERNVVAVGPRESIISRRDISVPTCIQEFAANAMDHSVELTWSVANDVVFEGFRLYRRDDGSRAASVTENLFPPLERSFTDCDVQPAKQYEYTLAAVFSDGSEIYSNPVTVRLEPFGLLLKQNYPNPFNPSTKISFTLPKMEKTNLSIYNIEGKIITTLVNKVMDEGYQEVTWDGMDSQGNPVSSGVYFYSLKAGSRTLTKKMVLLK